MNVRFHVFLAIALMCSVAAFAQNPITADSPFQVRYAANVGPGTPGDSVINITNAGASGGNICVNVYTFSPDEQEVSCCSCVVTPNGLVSLSVKNDLISNTLTPAVPGSVVVKLLATTGGACNASAPGALAAGMAAWGTTIHMPAGVPASLTETAFTPATPSAAEVGRIAALCGFIQANGSGFGICKSCRTGALGANRL